MNISAHSLKQELSGQNEVHIIDVREKLEFHTFNIGGENIPLGRLPGAIEEMEVNKQQPIVVVCQRGLRSETARRMLAAAGYENVKNLEGGLLAYRKLL